MNYIIKKVPFAALATHEKDGKLFLIHTVAEGRVPPTVKGFVESIDGYNPLPPQKQRVPSEIAHWRAKNIMRQHGILAAAEALINNIPVGDPIRDAWDDRAPFIRNGLGVTALSAQLGLTPEQIDAMFIQAASIPV